MSDQIPEHYHQAEMQPWIKNTDYHGRNIRVLEFDHVLTRGIDAEHITYPQNWREPLVIQIKNSGSKTPIMPEYFVPELYQGVYSNVALGKLALLKGRVEHVTPFFGYIAKVAGKANRDVVVADPGISTWYGIVDRVNLYGHVIPGTLAGKSFDEIYESYYGGLHKDSLTDEEKNISMVDARRLYTARGLMQESLRLNSDLLHITAPRHAERVVNYISRQIGAEKIQPLQSPEQMLTNGPKEEQLKMKGYALVLKPEIRRFKPMLTPESYRLDILVNDTPVQGYESPEVIEKEILNKITVDAQEILNNKPLNDQQKMFQNNLKNICLPIISRIITNPNIAKPEDYEIVRESVSTHHNGWKKISSDKIS